MKRNQKIVLGLAVAAAGLVLSFQNAGIIRKLPPVPVDDIPINDARILSQLDSDAKLQPIDDLVNLESEEQALDAISPTTASTFSHSCSMMIFGSNQNVSLVLSPTQFTSNLFRRSTFGTSLFNCVSNLNAAGALGSICHTQYVRPNLYSSGGGGGGPISGNIRPGGYLQYLIETYGYTMAIPQNGAIYVTSRTLSSNVTQAHPAYNYSCAFH